MFFLIKRGISKRRFAFTLRVTLCLTCLMTVLLATAALDFSAELLSNVKAKYGEQASERVLRWQALILSSQDLPEKEKLKQVNDFFNQQIEFVDDEYLWGVRDYWATPLEMLAKGAGDCEDYSIAKYFTLRELGVPDKKMRITYVKALELNQAHMVLTYFDTPRSVPVVLDNLIPTIKLASKRRDLLPVYSFNGSGLWLAKARGTGKKIGGSSKLNKWGGLKDRMLTNDF
ncbi:MAG: transglutaminase-like cysteine peptidase [Cycloclasticus sp.]|nr:transglutaminase-like cysteine peptidase [Cycloclasticus sp.]